MFEQNTPSLHICKHWSLQMGKDKLLPLHVHQPSSCFGKIPISAEHFSYRQDNWMSYENTADAIKMEQLKYIGYIYSQLIYF